MTKLHENYRCEICGNIVQLNHASFGELVCCGQPMKLLTENTEDAATEKHVPIIESNKNNEITIKVGEADHPMTEEHYIEWIEILTPNESYKQFLKPNDKPQTTFTIQNSNKIQIRAYCNLHGLWKNSI